MNEGAVRQSERKKVQRSDQRRSAVLSRRSYPNLSIRDRDLF